MKHFVESTTWHLVCSGVVFVCVLSVANADVEYGTWKKWGVENNKPVKKCLRSDKCECEVTGKKIPIGDGEVVNGCTWIVISTGDARVDSLLGGGFFQIWADTPTASLWTRQGLRYVRGGYGIHGISFEKTAGGVPQQVDVINSDGLKVIFNFADNESVGVPWGSTKDEHSTRILMVDAEGWATTTDPAYYDLYTGEGDRYRFIAATNNADYLQLVKYRSVRGREESISDWGSDIIWDHAGVLRQVKSPTGLADITTANNHKYSINFYKLSDIQAGKDTNGYYVTVTGAVALTTWTIDTAFFHLDNAGNILSWCLRLYLHKRRRQFYCPLPAHTAFGDMLLQAFIVEPQPLAHGIQSVPLCCTHSFTPHCIGNPLASPRCCTPCH